MAYGSQASYLMGSLTQFACLETPAEVLLLAACRASPLKKVTKNQQITIAK